MYNEERRESGLEAAEREAFERRDRRPVGKSSYDSDGFPTFKRQPAKPHIRKIQGVWYCFNSRPESRRRTSKAWWGFTPSGAYRSWASFNTMKR